jgi:hypothetical protein
MEKIEANAGVKRSTLIPQIEPCLDSGEVVVVLRGIRGTDFLVFDKEIDVCVEAAGKLALIFLGIQRTQTQEEQER